MSKLTQFQTGRVLPIASVVTFLGFLDTYLLIPVIALYAAELGAGIGTIGLIVGLYSLTNTPANILFGRLIDRIGYRIPLLAGLIGDALSMFLYSVCRLPVHLALVRMLHGITGASIGPATMSLMADYGDRVHSGRTMSFYGISIGMATLVGYALSGTIALKLGYKAVFLFGAGLLGVGVLLSLLLPGGGRQDGVRAEMSISELLRKAGDLFRRKGLLVSYSAIFAQFFTFGSVVTLLPLYARGVGLEAFHVGMSLAAFSVVFVVLQFPSGLIADRLGKLLPVVFGLCLALAALVMLPSVNTFLSLALVLAVYGAAFGMLFPSVCALIVGHTDPEERGLATGMFHALLTAGVAIGAPVMGWAGEMVGVKSAMEISAGIMVLALMVVMLSRKHVLSRR